jgi:hypothetical protein
LPPALLLPPRSPPPDLTCHRCPPLSLFAAVVVRHCHCHRPPLPLLSSTAVLIHRRHLPPLQPSLPLRVSAISHHPLLSIPFIGCRPILHAVIIRRCCCLPLLSSSAAAAAIITVPLSLPSLTYRSCLFPSQSAAQSHVSLLSATIIIRHRCHPPSQYLHSSSLQQDVDCCIVSRMGPPQQVICDGVNVP